MVESSPLFPRRARLITLFDAAEKNAFAVNDPKLFHAVQERIACSATPAGVRRSAAGKLDMGEATYAHARRSLGVFKHAMHYAELGSRRFCSRPASTRSQIYNLAAPNQALPRTPNQLQNCLLACKMMPRQVEPMVFQWLLLRERRRHGLALTLTWIAATDAVRGLAPQAPPQLEVVDPGPCRRRATAPPAVLSSTVVTTKLTIKKIPTPSMGQATVTKLDATNLVAIKSVMLLQLLLTACCLVTSFGTALTYLSDNSFGDLPALTCTSLPSVIYGLAIFQQMTRAQSDPPPKQRHTPSSAWNCLRRSAAARGIRPLH